MYIPCYHYVVKYQDPTIMIVALRHNVISVDFINVHAPHCGPRGRATPKVRDAVRSFWKKVREIVKEFCCDDVVTILF